jgi:tRNA(His) guanylyltransferase
VKDDIGDRFKRYEGCFDYELPRRLPLVIRVDGRAFHGLKLAKPFDNDFHSRMCEVAVALCKDVQGSVLAYTQSDEVSIIARDDMENSTEPWIGKRLSRILSLSAAIATSAFGLAYGRRQFDARAFVLPDLSEVTNYLIWRQQDATRNSVSMAAQAMFSHKSLHGVNSNGMLDRLREAGKPWEATPTRFKRGTVIRPVKVFKPTPHHDAPIERNEWQCDLEPPIFTANREYIETLYKLPELKP